MKIILFGFPNKSVQVWFGQLRVCLCVCVCVWGGGGGGRGGRQNNLFVCFVALRPKSTAMVIAGRSVHLTTLFPGQA